MRYKTLEEWNIVKDVAELSFFTYLAVFPMQPLKMAQEAMNAYRWYLKELLWI